MKNQIQALNASKSNYDNNDKSLKIQVDNLKKETEELKKELNYWRTLAQYYFNN